MRALIRCCAPQIVSTYSYAVRPLRGGGDAADDAPPKSTEGGGVHSSYADRLAGKESDSWEVRLLLEFCDKGTLRDALSAGALRRADGRRDMRGVLATALDVARAMVFLHGHHVVHSDLKARGSRLHVFRRAGGTVGGWPLHAVPT